MQQSGPWPKLGLACYPIQCSAVPRQRCSQFFAVPAVKLAINPKVFGHAERDAVQRAYAVREVWARMLLASSIPEAHPRPPIGCPGAHPLINLCCLAGTRWDGRAWFSPTFCAPLLPVVF